MLITDAKLRLLNQDRHNLMRQFDRKEIEEDNYNRILEEIDIKREERLQIFLVEYHKQKEEKVEQIKEKIRQMEEKDKRIKEEKKLIRQINKQMEEKKLDEEKKVIKTTKKGSKVALVGEALMKKSLKSPEDVAAWIKEKKPEEDLKKLTTYVKVIVNEIKKVKKPRWTGYTFDDNTYLLTPPAE